jgi:hypothetical protein
MYYTAFFSEDRKNLDDYGFKTVHIYSRNHKEENNIEGLLSTLNDWKREIDVTVDTAWELDSPRRSTSLSAEEIEMYDGSGEYLVSSKSLDIGFHVYVCGGDHPVCSRDLTPYFDWHYLLHGVFYLDTEKAIAALEKYKGYQLKVEITEGSFQTNENTKKAQQVFDVLKTCNGNKKNVDYKNLSQYGDMGFVIRDYCS